MFEKHSNVPHMRKNPETKQVATRMAMFCDCMVIRLQTIRTGQTVRKMRRVVKRNLSRNRMGKMTVMPMNEAYPAIMTSSLRQPKALDIWVEVGRNTPPLNWNTMAKNRDRRIQTGVGMNSLKYKILGRCSDIPYLYIIA